MSVNSRLPGFYKLSPEQRFDKIAEASDTSAEDLEALRTDDETLLRLADGMVENVVGVMALPLGIGANFRVNGQDYLVPMATEEPSVVAAASNLAQVAREHGGFFCSADEPVMIAQVQIIDVADPHGAKLRLFEHRDELLELANEQDPVLMRFGGGARDIEVRVIDGPKGTHVVLHLLVDVGDAMGANAVNTMAETLAPRIAEIARGRVQLRILSNLADRRLARARATFGAGKLGGPDVVAAILDAYQPRRRRPVPGGHPQQGHHERHQRGGHRHRQRLARDRGRRHSHAARGGRYSSLCTWSRTPTATWSRHSRCRWPSASSAVPPRRTRPRAPPSGCSASRPRASSPR